MHGTDSACVATGRGCVRPQRCGRRRRGQRRRLGFMGRMWGAVGCRESRGGAQEAVARAWGVGARTASDTLGVRANLPAHTLGAGAHLSEEARRHGRCADRLRLVVGRLTFEEARAQLRLQALKALPVEAGQRVVHGRELAAAARLHRVEEQRLMIHTQVDWHALPVGLAQAHAVRRSARGARADIAAHRRECVPPGGAATAARLHEGESLKAVGEALAVARGEVALALLDLRHQPCELAAAAKGEALDVTTRLERQVPMERRNVGGELLAGWGLRSQ